MTCNPLVFHDPAGDGWTVWCKACGWETGEPTLLAAEWKQRQHKRKGMGDA